MRLMTLDTAVTLNRVGVRNWVLMQKGPRQLPVTALTLPIMTCCEQRVFDIAELMTVVADDVFRNQRVRRAVLKFGRHHRMTICAKPLLFVFDKCRLGIIVNLMATGTGNCGPSMGISLQHRDLMRLKVTVRANCCLIG
jgi:hypothetical protein